MVHMDFTSLPPVLGRGIGVLLNETHPLVAATFDLLGVWAFLALLFHRLGFTSPRDSSAGSYNDIWAEIPQLDACLEDLHKSQNLQPSNIAERNTAHIELRQPVSAADCSGQTGATVGDDHHGHAYLARR